VRFVKENGLMDEDESLLYLTKKGKDAVMDNPSFYSPIPGESADKGGQI
jgi:hypothetical protein